MSERINPGPENSDIVPGETQITIEETGGPPTLSRKDFTLGGTALLVGGIAGFLAGRESNTQTTPNETSLTPIINRGKPTEVLRPEATPHDIERIYQNGEIIPTPIGNVHLDGWRARLVWSDLLKINDVREYSLSFFSPGMNTPAELSTVGNKKNVKKGITPGVTAHHLLEGSRIPFEFPLLPSEEGSMAYVGYREVTGGKPESKMYSVQLPESKQFKNQFDETVLYSEIDIPDGVASHILSVDTDLTRFLHTPVRTYLLDTKLAGSRTLLAQDGAFVYPAEIFIDDAQRPASLAQLVHDRAGALFDRFPSSSAVHLAFAEYSLAHKQLTDIVRNAVFTTDPPKDVGDERDRIMDHPYMRIFNPFPDPISSSNRTFADERSIIQQALATFIFYPEQFMQNIGELDEIGQELVKGVGAKVITFLEATNRDGLTNLVPELQGIKKRVA